MPTVNANVAEAIGTSGKLGRRKRNNEIRGLADGAAGA